MDKHWHYFRRDVITNSLTPFLNLDDWSAKHMWPGALAPGNQYPQCWVFIDVFPAVIWLTDFGRIRHICISNQTTFQQLVPGSAPSHYLNQCWDIVNWTNFSEISIKIHIFSFNAFKNIVRKMAAILSQPQYVNFSGPPTYTSLGNNDSIPGWYCST